MVFFVHSVVQSSGLLIYSLDFVETPMVRRFRYFDNLHSDEVAVVLPTASRPRDTVKYFFFIKMKISSYANGPSNNIISVASGLQMLNGRETGFMVFSKTVFSSISSVCK